MRYKNSLYLIVAVTLCSSLFSSCVSQKAFDAMKTDKFKYENESKNCKSDLTKKLEEIADLNRKLVVKEGIIEGLKQDTINKNASIAQMKREYNTMNELYDAVNNNYSDLISSSSSKTKKMLLQLGEKEQLLLDKELSLSELERTLNLKQTTIDDLYTDLALREAKVNELERVIAAKDSAVNALKNTIMTALKGVNEGDLSIEMKNGKVYVTLSNKLLFTSGSTVVDEAGKNALSKLANVLNDNKDIHVMVEGHTDTDKGLDNWDLSVKRATSIVRILSDDYKVDPTRVTASGRGEFMPVASNKTAEGKGKNRRTEIILTPNLDELFTILNAQ